MARPTFRQNVILVVVLIVATLLGIYLAWQLRSASTEAPANFLSAHKGYGVTVDLARLDDEALAQTLNLLRENSLTWLRLPVAWAEIEAAPGQFDWQPLDRVMGQINNGPDGFTLIPVLHAAPAWARPADRTNTAPPTEVSDFGRFTRAFADRYGRQIDYYQVWREPNLSQNWGGAFVDPSAYADLLREAALGIRAADPEAYILTAALAPTLEEGPLNLNELAYLDGLYRHQADQWFDIVAAQPYGFDQEPDSPAGPDRLNFRRVELLRQVMVEHGDAETPVWATAFGWNALPANWNGRPSPWHSDIPSVQAERTESAIDYARQNWPWLGPMLAIRWDADNLAADDPAQGFALLETPRVLQAIRAAAAGPQPATVGLYPADHASGQYSDGWRFALSRADIARQAPRRLAIPFEGTRLDLLITRGPYRGYLWVTVDGRPANALPQDGQGRSYVVLYDPLRDSEAVTLAHHLPDGPHRAVIEADGGWGQWALQGWQVFREADRRYLQAGLAVAATAAALSGLGLLWSLLRASGEVFLRLWAWGEVLVALYAPLGGRGQTLITFALAIAFYLAPGRVSLLLLPLLGLTVLLRPDLGLTLVAFSLSFFQALKPLPGRAFSPVELALLLTVAGFVFRALLALGRARYAPFEQAGRPARSDSDRPAAISQTLYPNSQTLSQIFAKNIPNSTGTPTLFAGFFNSADWAALALVGLAFMATLAAANFGVSMREWRVVVFESALFYFLVRLGSDFSPLRPTYFEGETSPSDEADRTWRWAWRLADAFVAGAAVQALLALYFCFFTDQSITAEGVRRALGLAYGSPNNLALFLGRAWPILLAVGLFSGGQGAAQSSVRLWLYRVALVPVSLAVYLTFSKGALLLGLPASLVAMAGLYQVRHGRRNWRRAVAIAVGGLILMGLALIPLSRTERFRTMLDFNQGSTGFFRLKLWQASLAMLRDHWPLGLGLDNFLYQYRTRYIRPEAWQEPDLSHPHNLALDFGVRLGLGGIVILLWLQVAFWRNAWQLYRRTSNPLVLGLMGSMAAFVSHGLVDNSYFLVDLAFIFFLTVGVVQRLVEQVDH